MKTLETKRTEMCICVSENRQQFPLAEAEGLDGAKLFDDLGQFVEQVRSGAHDQSRADSSMRENSADIDKAREKLLSQLEAIRRTVRVTGLSGLEDKFLPPRHVPDLRLLTLAQTYGTDAFPIKAALIKKGLGVDFINDLAEATQKLDEEIKERERRLGKRIEATAGIGGKVEEAVRVVRELDVIVRNVYTRDPAKLTLWESVSHVEKSPRHSRQDDEGESQPAPPAQG
jgi:hypothetical protein